MIKTIVMAVLIKVFSLKYVPNTLIDMEIKIFIYVLLNPACFNLSNKFLYNSFLLLLV